MVEDTKKICGCDEDQERDPGRNYEEKPKDGMKPNWTKLVKHTTNIATQSKLKSESGC